LAFYPSKRTKPQAAIADNTATSLTSGLITNHRGWPTLAL
jgi:hypothetical protein